MPVVQRHSALIESCPKLISGVVKYPRGPRVEFLGVSRGPIAGKPRVGFLFGRDDNMPVYFSDPDDLRDCAKFLKAAADELEKDSFTSNE